MIGFSQMNKKNGSKYNQKKVAKEKKKRNSHPPILILLFLSILSIQIEMYFLNSQQIQLNLKNESYNNINIGFTANSDNYSSITTPILNQSTLYQSMNDTIDIVINNFVNMSYILLINSDFYDTGYIFQPLYSLSISVLNLPVGYNSLIFQIYNSTMLSDMAVIYQMELEFTIHKNTSFQVLSPYLLGSLVIIPIFIIMGRGIFNFHSKKVFQQILHPSNFTSKFLKEIHIKDLIMISNKTQYRMTKSIQYQLKFFDHNLDNLDEGSFLKLI